MDVLPQEQVLLSGVAVFTLSMASTGPFGWIISLVIAAPIAFTGSYIGTTLQNDINYDGRLDGKNSPDSSYYATIEGISSVIASTSKKPIIQVLAEAFKRIFKLTDAK